MSLPYPFNIIETDITNFFNGLVNDVLAIPGQIFTALTNLGNTIYASLSPLFTALQGAVWQQLLNIKDQILGAFAGVPQAINNLVGGLEAGLQPFISGLTSSFSAFVNDLYQRFINFVAPVITNAIAYLSGFLQPLQRDVNNLGVTVNSYLSPTIANISSVLNGVPGYISTLGSDVKQFFATSFGNFTAAFNGVTGFITDNFNKFNLQLSTLGAGISGAAGSFDALFKPLTDLAGLIWTEGTSIVKEVYDKGVKPIIDTVFASANAFRGQLTNLFSPKSPLDPNQVIAITTSLGAAASTILAARWGINLLGKVLTIGQVSALQNDFSELLATLGVVGIGRQFNMAPIDYGVIPFVQRGWQNIFRPRQLSEGEILQVIDRANPDFVKILSAPPLVKKVMAELGHPDEAIDQLFTSHFVPLGIGQARDAFLRGFIDDGKYDTYLQLASIRPDDRAIFKQLIYELPGIRQSTNLAKLGLLSGDMIHDIAKASGFRQDFQDAFVAALQEPNLLPVLNRIETTAITAYADDLINDSDFTDLMHQARKPDNIIESELKLARLKRTLALKQFQIQTVEQAMLRGIITFDQGRTELTGLGVEPERIGVIIARALYLAKIKGAKGTDKQGKQLSVAQIIKAVKVGAIPLEDGYNAVQARGYDSNDTKVLFEIALGVPS